MRDRAGAVGPSPAPSVDPNRRRFLRSSDDRILAGVAGGLGNYFNIDPIIVRIAFAVSVFFGGLGILAYLAIAVFVPGRRRHRRPGRVECRSPRPAGAGRHPRGRGGFRRLRRAGGGRGVRNRRRPRPPRRCAGRGHRHRPRGDVVQGWRPVADRAGAGADAGRRSGVRGRPRPRGRNRRPRLPAGDASRRSPPTATSSASAASRSTCAASTGGRSRSSTSTPGSAPARRSSRSRPTSASSPTPTSGAGLVRVAGQQSDGWDVDLATGAGARGRPQLRMNADVDAGEIRIVNDDDISIDKLDRLPDEPFESGQAARAANTKACAG